MRKIIICLFAIFMITGCSQNEKVKYGLKSIDNVSELIKKDEKKNENEEQESTRETENEDKKVNKTEKETAKTETKRTNQSSNENTSNQPSSSQSDSQKQENAKPSDQFNANKNEKPITPTPQPQPDPTPIPTPPPHTCSDIIPAGAFTDENEMDKVAQQKVLELLDTYGTAGYSVEYGETECGTRYCIPIYYYS